MSSDGSSDGSDEYASRVSERPVLASSGNLAKSRRTKSNRKSHKTDESYSRRNTGPKSEPMEFLPEVDDELDYNEDELPAISRPYDSNDKRHLSSAFPHDARVFSPREEGEELSEEDYDEHGDPVNETKGVHSSKPTTFNELEEGEASSDEDQRRPKPQSNSRLLLEEAEYRNRLHERHEKRARERDRLRVADVGHKGKSSGPSRTQSEFLQPRPKFTPDPQTDHGRSILSRSASPENVHSGRKWSSSRMDSLDKGHPRIPVESVYDESDVRRSNHKRSSNKNDENPDPNSQTKSESVIRSYSSSYLLNERPVEEQVQYHSGRSSRHSSKDREGRKSSKSKKSKRDRHGKMEEPVSKSGGKSHKTQMQFVDWESYVYGKANTQLLGKRSHSPMAIVTSPRTSGSSSPSGSVSPSPVKGHREPADTRKHPSHSAFVDPQSVKHSRKKHKHRYHREARETAPPPEPGRGSFKLEPDPVISGKHRGHRSDKQLVEDSDQPASYQSKRSRSSKESKDQHTSKYPGENRRSHSKSREKSVHAFREPHTKLSPPLSDHVQEPPKKRLAKAPLNRSPFREDEEEEEEEEATSEVSDQNETENPPVEPIQRKIPESIDQLIKEELKPSRFKQYRLYSGSEDDDDDQSGSGDDEQAVDEANESMIDHNDLDKSSPIDEQKYQPHIPSKPFYFPSIQGCRSVEEFECLNRIEEGTYGVVYRARDKKINEIVALKRLKMEKERDGFPITSLREINTLMKAQHENIVTVREIVVGSNMDKIYLVMDYVEHDLKSLMEIMNGPFSVGEVKCLLVQLLKAVRHLHDNWILHRDLKTSNLLLSHQGILKVGDFGLAREYGSPLKHYTEVVVTLWYRAPELLLGAKQYTCPIDLWSVGCIFAEFLLQRPLFPGKGEVDELNIIFRDLGTPTERIWPGVSQLPGMKKCVFTEYPYNQLRRRFTEKQISDLGFDLLNNFLTYCPEKRITADKALTHPYFNERPRAIHPSMFPSWPAKSEGAVAARKATSPRPPVAGGGALAAAAAAIAAAANSSAGGARVRYQPPAPPMGGQRFYSTMAGGDSRPGTLIGSGEMVSGSLDKGFLLRF